MEAEVTFPMNEKALRILEYNKILELLSEHATSASGQALCRSLLPMSDPGEIEAAQSETADAFSRLIRRGSVSFDDVTSVDAPLRRLGIGGTLNSTELLRLCALLENTARVKAYGRPERDDEPDDTLSRLFTYLDPVPSLSAEIRRCLLSEDEVSDDASPELRRIRRSLAQSNDRIHTTLTGMVNGSCRTYLQDTVITMRDNRYCIPVKAEYKNQVPGMVHDQSSSGSTLFIEPMAVVKLNNELKELFAQEQQEIQAIMARLSSLAAENSELIAQDFSIMTRLDFIFAKGALALDENAVRPVFSNDRHICIRKGRHPLLDRDTVVPIDIELGRSFTLLVVTGPNTGGKTVSLKTVGLLTLMGEAGLHIPAAEHSELGLFTEVFADIGDEQSIEQSLSTFSSHMTNIVGILRDVTDDSLVLFDELGAGTDPTEGAALAISILSELHKRGIRAMATTHYSELKIYALSTDGVMNASCEFNVETLRPTYRILIGIPGKSNAFAISSRLGLPDTIIEEAKRHIGEQEKSFEDVITDLEASRVTLEREQAQLASGRAEVETLRRRLEQEKHQLDEQQDKILHKAQEDARKILQDAKDYADETMKNFRRFGNENVSASDMERERDRLRQKIAASRKGDIAPPEKKPVPKNSPKDFHIGDTVKVHSMNVKGTVSTLPDRQGYLYVQMGIIRSKVSYTDLEILPETDITGPGSFSRTSGSKIRMGKSLSVAPEINLLGMTVDEAVSVLDKYLDDAFMAHLESVRIVHGKGTGALRSGVHQYLKHARHVKDFRLGGFGEGDAGVTIVTFK